MFGDRGIPGDVYTTAWRRRAAKIFASDVTVCGSVSNNPSSAPSNRGVDEVGLAGAVGDVVFGTVGHATRL
jgi:hypothetical protein